MVQAMLTAYSTGCFLGPILLSPFVLPLEGKLASESAVRVHWAYLSMGLALMAISFTFLPFYYEDKKTAVAEEEGTEEKIPEDVEEAPPLVRQIVPIFLVAAIYHFNGGISVSIGENLRPTNTDQTFFNSRKFHLGFWS